MRFRFGWRLARPFVLMAALNLQQMASKWKGNPL
jgi:hypothetical protein